MVYADMGANEWLLIAAAIVGPVLAVQAQKAVERSREKTSRRNHVFLVLMATRAARLSPGHVEALNSIDIAFYGKRILGRAIRSTTSQNVIDSWNNYRRHLTPEDSTKPLNEVQIGAWNSKREELFVNLLEALAIANKYRFDRETLQAGVYSPQAYGDREKQQQDILSSLLEILSGNRSLPLDIRQWPVDPAAVAQARESQTAVGAALTRLADKFDPPTAEEASAA